MAIFKNVSVVLVVIVAALETVILEERSTLQENIEYPGQPHSRHKRNGQPSHLYEVDVELNVTDIRILDRIRTLLYGVNVTLGSNVNITNLEITTVCSPNGTNFQCRCEDPFSWSRERCITYGACSEIVNDTCTCISSLPPDGKFCMPPPAPPAAVYEYQILLEVNTTQPTELKNRLSVIVPLEISRFVNITKADITTVCSPSSDGFQCRCGDEYRWSCDQCETHHSCDNITGGACSCIRRLPDGGPYCLPVDQHNFTECGTTTTGSTTAAKPTIVTITATTEAATTAATTETTITTTAGATTSTADPPVVEEYLLFLQLNFTDGRLVEKLRDVLAGGLPFTTHSLSVSSINITTVCAPVGSSSFQCTCEDRYRWSCDQCQRYQSCDGIVNNTCGCISGFLPDGDFCRSVDEHNFTECTTTTAEPLTNTTTVSTTGETTTTVTSTLTNSTPVATTNKSTTDMSSETNATTVSTTNVTTTTVTSAPTNSTPVVTTQMSTTEANTTTVSTTGEMTTTVTSTLTNSTPAAITNMSTTDMSSETNATTVSTANVTTTTVTSAPTTNTTAVSKTNVMPTIVTRAPTTKAVNSTTSVNSTTVTRATTTNITGSSTAQTTLTTPGLPVLTVMMSVTLDLTFDEDLANSDSARYRDLAFRLNAAFTRAYQGITGFRGVSVTRFRSGSVIVDFSISAAGFVATEITNVDLASALSDIARVIGSVVAQYNSQNPIEKPETTFTTRDLRLTCGPPEVNVGDIDSSMWTFNGLEIGGNRRQVALSGNMSTLTVMNVIQADQGEYECTLSNGLFDYIQRGEVPASTIVAAPLVRLQNSINMQCEVGLRQPLECCVQDPFNVVWRNDGRELESRPSAEEGCITSDFEIESCDQPEFTESFTCDVVGEDEEFNKVTRLTIFVSNFSCEDDVYGRGRLGDNASARCGQDQLGTRTAVCEDGEWRLVEDTCILTVINELLIDSEDLTVEEVPPFTERLNEAVRNAAVEISQSPATINAIVQILNTIADTSVVVSQSVTQNVLEVIDVIIGDNSRESWDFLNLVAVSNTSSVFLGSLETLTDRVEGLFMIQTPRILFNRTAFSNSFMAQFNSSVSLDIPLSDVSDVNITTITFPTLNNVMPTRNSSVDFNSFADNSTNETTAVINAAVVLIKISTIKSDTNETVFPNVTLTYKKLNQSLQEDPQCVFWNFTLFGFLGAWDNQGCQLVSQGNDNVTCFCDHLTSFSILMSTSIPEDIIVLLDIITYIGVGISMASLVISLIIEGYVWKDMTRNSTAFMRHVSIINTAISLLIANICFIVGAAIAKNESENPNEDHRVPVGPCSTVTFFMHLFYLAVFFWMLVSGLLLLYRTVMVFSHMSKSTMLAIGFMFGYICPLLIAVVTVASTAGQGGYIREDLACWLNWTETRALLAMVIPALIIVFINSVIVIVVLIKMLRRGAGTTSQPDEKNSLVVIIRCVAILTPLFGLTWGLGVGTMISPNNRGIHIAFAFFNSFQGFFILVFGILLDSKVRALLSRRIPALSTGSHPTQSTSGDHSSSSGMIIFNRFRRNRNVYRVSEAANTNSSVSETFLNT